MKHYVAFLLAVAVGPTAGTVRGNDWPEWMGPNRDGVWRETGLLEKFPVGGPKRVWAMPLGGGNGSPTVAKGRVYVMDRQQKIGADGKPTPGDKGSSPGSERVICVDAKTGKQIWAHEYDCAYSISYRTGPRTAPLVRDGRLYSLGTMGDLRCLNADTGALIWAKNLRTEYSVKPQAWGWAAAPLLDGDLLYCLVGGEGSAVCAFDKNTGKEVWKALTTEEVGYSPPTIIEAGKTRQLIIWHSDSINSLDPVTGKVYWTQPYPAEGSPQRPAPTIIIPRLFGDLLFVSSYYHGPMMLKLAGDRPAAELLWKDKTTNLRRPVGLHCLMATPVIKDNHVYGVCMNGELRCCNATTGDQLWETYEATGGKKADCGTAFIIPQGDRFVIFNDLGELILANLSPSGYTEIDKARIIEPIEASRGRNVVWCHPAFADRHVFVRNMKELVCVTMAP